MARDIVVTGLVPLPGDVLLIDGTIDGQPVQATGWQSATTNHFDPDAYGPDGHRRDDVAPRAMRAEEVDAYARGVLDAQNPPARPAPGGSA